MAGKSEHTRERILAAALQLFNERGATRVDTHDIAKRARMSPGNLYYHYPNKREIIRDLFERIELFQEDAWRRRGPGQAGASFVDFLDFFFGSAAKHRFFFLDFSLLLRDDPGLASRWRAAHRRLSKELTSAARGWVGAGVMLPFADDEDLQGFIDNAWILCHYAAGYIETRGLVDAGRAHAEGARLLLSFLRPYHAEHARRALDAYAARLPA